MWARDKIFDPSLSIQTIDGREAKIYETLPSGAIAAFIQKNLHSNEWVLQIFHKDGRTHPTHRLQELACVDDLVNIKAKVKKEGWILIYPTESRSWLGVIGRQTGIYKTKAAAETKVCALMNIKSPLPVDIVKVEWEEEE